MERTITVKSETQLSDLILLMTAALCKGVIAVCRRGLKSILVYLDTFYTRIQAGTISNLELVSIALVGALVSQILIGFGIHP